MSICEVTRTKVGCTKGSSTINITALEPDTIGMLDNKVLVSLDNVLKLLHKHDTKAIISPHDGNLLPRNDSSIGFNGCDVYCKKHLTSDSFYSSTAKQEYDRRIAHILDFVSPSFGKLWSQLSEVTMAFGLQDEPMIASKGKLAAIDSDDWLYGRARNMKSTTYGSGVKIATGGIGGTQYSGHEPNIIPKALYFSAIDVPSVHGYQGSVDGLTPYIPLLEQQVVGQGKQLMVEEWGVAIADGQFDAQVAFFNGKGIPWVNFPRLLSLYFEKRC